MSFVRILLGIAVVGLFVRLWRRLLAIIGPPILPPLPPPGLKIAAVSSTTGWPGTILTIIGTPAAFEF